MSFNTRLQSWVLRRCLHPDDAEGLAGDLAAEVPRLSTQGFGAVRIWMWHWRQVLSACAHAALDGVTGWGRLQWPVRSDLRLAYRSLRRRPLSTLAMVATLALGLGANAAGYTVVDALLFRPLPYPDADQLVVLHEVRPTEPDEPGGVSYLNFVDWRSQTRAFASMALVVPEESAVSLNGVVIPVSGLHVTPGFFQTLGIAAAQGRTFDDLADDGLTQAGAWPLLLSDRGWRRHFGAAPDIVGRTVDLDGHLVQIVGVTPPGIFPLVEEPIDYWATTVHLGRASDPDSANGSRNFRQYPGVLARLRPGVTLQDALLDLQRVQASQRAEHPGAFRDRDVRIDPLRAFISAQATSLVGLLYGLVTIVWLVACVNVTNMSLARAAARQREVSIRRALGASRLAIMRQFVLEGLVIAGLGAATGLFLATWFLAAAVQWLPADFPSIVSLAPDTRVAVVMLGVAVVTALICGGIPAWVSLRSPAGRLHVGEGRQPGTGVPRSLRDALIAVEVALALVLLTSAGLLTNSLLLMQREAPGFDAASVWTTRLTLSGPSPARAEHIAQQLTDLRTSMRQIAGVADVAFSQSVPYTGFENSTKMVVSGAPAGGPSSSAQLRFVTPEYFSVMAIPVRSGRSFTARDAVGSPDVLMVNEAFVRAHLADGHVLGRTVELGWGGNGPKSIVGVVGDVRHRGPGDDVRPEMYVPQAQFANTAVSALIRMEPGRTPVIDEVYRAVRSVWPNMPQQPVRSLTDYRADTLSLPRFSAVAAGGFATLTLVLAAVGLFGVTTYLTEQRTQEIGVRMALGADRASVLWLVVRQALRPLSIGLVLGALTAWATTGVLRQWLYGVSPSDPATLVGAIVLLVCAAGAACVVPARRAVRIDPVAALRAD